ncbi:hypothetical protein PN836_020275 [Ningiella sp. W23]|uniref:hypothetical protein n=1 Tax=Ningiella sp. W23 TaxID=3023715 RepID=UPI003756BA23
MGNTKMSANLHTQIYNQSELKQLGTVETLSVILEHRKIMSDCIKEMDASGVNYITEQAVFQRVKAYTELVKPELKRRLRIAFSTNNLMQAHIVMDVDKSQGEHRLYFQSSVLDVVRLCDVSLYKKLTDVQLQTHLAFLNQAFQQMSSGSLNFIDNDDDFVEYIDNLFMNIGRLLSDIRQNVVKMQSLGKELEKLTAKSVKADIDTHQYIEAKQHWLDEIVKLYERHILPVLLFLNPDTSYEGMDGLHSILSKISTVLENNMQTQLANSCQAYALSLLNFYQPIESTANAVNRFIHKQRDSIKRFNAIEHFYQSRVIAELQKTQSHNLNKKLLSDEAIVLPHFSPSIKAFSRPMGYAFNDSPAYYKNLFNELEARIQDIDVLGDLSAVISQGSNDNASELRLQRFYALQNVLSTITLRDTKDLTKMLHQRLKDDFPDYRLFDLISAVQFFANKRAAVHLKHTNHFASAQYNDQEYQYRKVRCEIPKQPSASQTKINEGTQHD